MITFGTPKHHWNYFLAIEKDLEKISRYIEFANQNLGTYSIELTHILLSASSEVDVIMKQLCSIVNTTKNHENINDYKLTIQAGLVKFIDEEITIDRFGLRFKPWENWSTAKNPDWWKSYNNVKHQRNNYFHEANLQNTINAVGALLIAVTYYYNLAFSKEAKYHLSFKETTLELKPEPSFLKINADYYHGRLLI